MIDSLLIIPFGAPEADEFPHAPVTIPNWTEFYLNFAYDPVAQLGVWVHIGRERDDSSVWRSTIHLFLPDEALLIAKYYGRNGHARGPGAGPLTMTCIQPMRLWDVSFDGMMQRSSRKALATGLVEDSPSELVKFHILLEAASPFATHSADLMQGQSWAHFHSEQVCSVRGEITVGGRAVSIRGVGARDHSCGPRDYAAIEGDMWLMGRFPSGKCLLAQYVRIRGHEPDLRLAYIHHADGTPMEKVELLDCPIATDLNAPDASVPADPMDPSCQTYQIVLRTRLGRETIKGEILHASVISAFSPFHEYIGTATDHAEANQMCESPTRLHWNGEIGYGLRERGLRVSKLRLLPKPGSS